MMPTRRSKRVKRAALVLPGDDATVETTSDCTERVYETLVAGALSFLTLRDAVAVLSTCHVLRNDVTLGVTALSNTRMGPHLLRQCAMDCLHIGPLKAEQHVDKFFGECRNQQCRRSVKMGDVDGAGSRQDDESETINQLLLDHPRIGRAGRDSAELLSLIGMVQEHILPICHKYTVMNKFGDLCSARPVLLPLVQCPRSPAMPDRDHNLSTSEWTKDAVKRSLNACWNGFGDNFTSQPSEHVYVSDVGAHWENISVQIKRSEKVNCNFCDTAKKAVREYRKEAKAMLKRFKDVLGVKKQKWRAEGLDSEEIHQKRSELKSKFFPEDSYPDVNFADSLDDHILADICESGRFPMNPFEGMAMGFDRANDDVFNALSEQYMDLCDTLFQPLKKVLTKFLPLVGGRVHRTWMNAEEGMITSELIAGVTLSGFLCGVFIVVKKVEYEAPVMIELDNE
uniref:Uncharacterized protein n=1 Tax=Globisporangium ultimum (strain ATCC 200006 / CBS 805.95 / DAOM BR144) TaxID=431595 RepID=K3W9Q3_GLOUD